MASENDPDGHLATDNRMEVDVTQNATPPTPTTQPTQQQGVAVGIPASGQLLDGYHQIIMAQFAGLNEQLRHQDRRNEERFRDYANDTKAALARFEEVQTQRFGEVTRSLSVLGERLTKLETTDVERKNSHDSATNARRFSWQLWIPTAVAIIAILVSVMTYLFPLLK